MAVGRGSVERCVGVVDHAAGRCAARQQILDRHQPAVCGRNGQRGRAVVGMRSNRGAGIYNRIDGRGIAPAGGVMQTLPARVLVS